MSAVGTITRLAGTVVTRTAHVVTHPIETTRYAAGLARDAAGAVLPIGGDDDTAPGEAPTSARATTPDPAAAAGRPPVPATEAPDPVATEPSAPSRNAQHGGPGGDAIDDWQAEVADGPDVETPVGTTGAGPGFNPDTGDTDLQQPGTEPLMDPSLTKAVKAESETMRKAAESPTEE